MSDKFNYAQLFEVYGSLLTEKQKSVCELYFSCDLSFGEIAEIKGISRQSVNDALKAAKAELDKLENALRYNEIKIELNKLAGELDENLSKRLTEILDK